MAASSKIRGLAERVAARSLGVTVDEVRSVLDSDETSQLIGFSGFDIWTLVAAIMQVLMDQIGNCPARKSTFDAIRNPGLFARVHMRRRAVKVFDEMPEVVWQGRGAAVARIIEEEAAKQTDEELAAMFVEAKNPPLDLMLI